MYVARKSTQAPPPRRFLRTTCSNVYPPGVAAVADTVSSQDSHVSVKHNMSRSWSTTKSAKKAPLLQTYLAFSRHNLAGRTFVVSIGICILLPREESGPWSKLEDGTLLLLVSCVAYGHPHDSPDGWVGGVPPLRRTLLSRQYYSDGCSAGA